MLAKPWIARVSLMVMGVALIVLGIVGTARATPAGPVINCQAHALYAGGHLTTYVTSNRADHRNVYSYRISWFGHGTHTYIPAFRVNTVSLPAGWKFADIDEVQAWQAGTACHVLMLGY